MFQDLIRSIDPNSPPGIDQAPPPPTQLPPDVQAMEDFLTSRGTPVAPNVQQAQAQAPADQGADISVDGLPPYERKGLFGVKGTLRDILGLIGDAFLVQSGNKPMYAPRRDEERKAEALHSFFEQQGGPGSQLNKAGYASDAFGVYKDLAAQQLDKSKVEVDKMRLARDQANDVYGNISKKSNSDKDVLANIRSSLAGLNGIKDPQERALAYQRRKQYIDAYLGSMDPDGSLRNVVKDILPADYAPGVENLFIDPQQIARLQDYDQARQQQAQLAREAEAGRNSRFKQAEVGKQKRFEQTREDKKNAAKPLFKLPPPPPGFK